MPLCCAALLTGCNTVKTGPIPDSFYQVPAWPKGKPIAENPNATQKDVAKYAVRGKASYDTCKLRVDVLQKINNNSFRKK